MNRYIQYHVSVHTFSYHTVVPTSAYYLMVSTLCMTPQLLPISHGATLTYLPYCRVTKSSILLLPPIQSLRSEWVSHTSPLYAYDISPHLLASTHLHLSTVIILWVYSCLFQFQSLLQLSHSIIYYHQTVYSFNYIVLHRSSCSTLHHSIWNKQYTSWYEKVCTETAILVCTSWYHCLVRKGIHWNVVLYVPVHTTTLYIPVSEQVSSYNEFPAKVGVEVGWV